MTPKFSSQIESDEFLTLSKTIQAGSYEDALTIPINMLERYSASAGILPVQKLNTIRANQ